MAYGVNYGMLDTRDNVFAYVAVNYLARGGATITWQLARVFQDPGPYDFRVQVGSTGVAVADDWTYIDSGPTTNIFSEVDTVRRGFGKQQRTHYRVELTTPLATYYSHPASTSGIMDKHYWNIAREIVRQNRLLMDRSTAVTGWLLKRRWNGAGPSPMQTTTAVTDPLDGSITVPTSTATMGTPFTGGFYSPYPIEIEVNPSSHREMISLESGRGTTDEAGMVISGRAIMNPELTTLDAFVISTTDRRYYFQTIKNVAEIRGVPLIAEVELRLAPVNDVIYAIEIPLQFITAPNSYTVRSIPVDLVIARRLTTAPTAYVITPIAVNLTSP